MRIALYGYGKMGKAIEHVALSRGHEVVLRVAAENAGTPPIGADVAIEFSRPEQALANMELCLAHKVPVGVGTTGWNTNSPCFGPATSASVSTCSSASTGNWPR